MMGMHADRNTRKYTDRRRHTIGQSQRQTDTPIRRDNETSRLYSGDLYYEAYEK